MTTPADSQASLEGVLKDEIVRMYQEVADDPSKEFHFFHGAPSLRTTDGASGAQTGSCSSATSGLEISA
jgi:hypothetical protein